MDSHGIAQDIQSITLSIQSAQDSLNLKIKQLEAEHTQIKIACVLLLCVTFLIGSYNWLMPNQCVGELRYLNYKINIIFVFIISILFWFYKQIKKQGEVGDGGEGGNEGIRQWD